MADSGALRASRARKHKAGDHRLCRSDTCDAAGDVERDEPLAVTERVTSAVTTGSRGGHLWSQMHEGRGLSPTHVVLLEEACRLADRLDQMDAALKGSAFLEIETTDGGVVEVVVNKLLAEARMQETALKGIVAELRQAVEDGAGASRPPGADPWANPKLIEQGRGGGNVVGLRSRIAEKRAQTAG